MSLDLDALEAIAGAAWGGPWEQTTSARSGRPIVVESDEHAKVAGVYQWAPGDGGTDPGWSNAAHIAAFDPPTALALIDAVRARDRRIASLLRVIRAEAGNAEDAVKMVEALGDHDHGLALREVKGIASTLRAVAADE